MSKIIKGEATNGVVEFHADGTSVGGSPTIVTFNDAQGNVITHYGDIPDNWISNLGFSISTDDIETLILGTSCEKIGYEAFKRTSLLSGGISFPNGFKIPPHIREIGSKAFYRCVDIIGPLEYTNENLIVPGGNLLSDAPFEDCTGITSVILPANVVRIPDFAFAHFSFVTDLTVIPSTVTKIGTGAFSGCTGLTGTVTIPNHIQEFEGNRIQYSPRNSTEIFYGGGQFYGCSNITSLVIPEGITVVPSQFAQYCSSLSSVTLPSTIKHIGQDAFSFCTSLSTVNLPASLETIDKVAFKSCSSLTSITIPTSVIAIDDSAFSTSGLTSISLPSGLTYLGPAVFSNCSSLASISIPPLITEINYYTFHSATLLLNITFESQNNLQHIDGFAFYGCSSLNTIRIPDSVISMGYENKYMAEFNHSRDNDQNTGSVFKNCTGLSDVYIGPNLTADSWRVGFQDVSFPREIVNKNFEGVPNTCTLHVHTDVLAGYDEDWKTQNGFTGTVAEWTNYPTI